MPILVNTVKCMFQGSYLVYKANNVNVIDVQRLTKSSKSNGGSFDGIFVLLRNPQYFVYTTIDRILLIEFSHITFLNFLISKKTHKFYLKALLLSLDDEDKFTYSFIFKKQDSF